MTEFESKCYGMSEDEMRARYGNYAKVVGTEMFVAGLLSDCQELMTMGQSDRIRMQNEERVRKQLNVAKFILFEMMHQREGVE